MFRFSSFRPSTWGIALGCALITACSAGSGSRSSSSQPVFGVEQISVAEGAIWRINRPIDIRFTREVDFSTVNLNTIGIRDLLGEPAAGQFQLIGDGRTVRFNPTCPTQGDFSDAGLRPSSTYRLLVLGTASEGVTVLATDGDEVEVSQSRTFHTPDSMDPLQLFLDEVAGPPAVRVRGRDGVGSDAMTATHLETFDVLENGEVVPRRVYFRWSTDTQMGFLEENPYLPTDPQTGAVEVPLNLYSRAESRISVLVYVDQPVNPTVSSTAVGLVAFEYEASPGSWVQIASELDLEANCTETGAILRLTPLGILPQDVPLRVNLRQGFQDITGDRTILDSVNFARMEVTAADNPVAGSGDAGRSADEVFETFAMGGDVEGSLEDTTALFGEPAADWGGGQLRASFDFGGTGGPGGDFSWIVPAGTTRILDSTTDVITGGPNGVPTSSQTVVNGVIDVADLVIEEGATLLVQGPNPLTILAAGNVTILGTLSVSGSASPGVGTLNTTNLPEPGGSGQAGGGMGGTASFLTNQSTPRGGAGSGAFSQGMGGQGGETSYATGNKANRRGSGGGGGRFGPDVVHPFDSVGTPILSEDPNVLAQGLIGLDAEGGFDGGPLGLGALSQTQRAQGGDVGPAPFFDDNPLNDFLGSKIRRFTEEVNGEPELREELIIGELGQLWAGSGGGAGGDAVTSDSFPLTPFNIGGDEKGAGGGGGGGGLRILATGDVVIGPNGEIHADGGGGGGGENTNFFDRIGGGSGGGSGGHIVISTAGALRIEADAAAASVGTTWYNDNSSGGRARPITALGGEGGAGQGSNGGFNEDGPRLWRCDAIPYEAFADVNTGEQVVFPPLDIECFRDLPGVMYPGTDYFNWIDPDDQATAGAGGDGSPGVIQIHVNDPLNDITFPDGSVYGQGAPVTNWFAPPPHGWNSPEGIDVVGSSTTVNVPPDFMVPFFGRLSRSRSKWVPLGLARVNPDTEPVAFQFTGTTGGLIDQDAGRVDLGAPLLGPLPMGSDQPPFVMGDAGQVLVLDASPLTGANEIYRRNPALLRELSVRLEEDGDPDQFSLFDIVGAEYEAESDRLTVQVGGDAPLELPGDADVLVSLVRRDFRIVTNSAVDVLPQATSISILFQATVADSDGVPSESAASPLTADVSDLNLDLGMPGDYVPWDFIRFEVTFDLNALGEPEADLASTPRPGLDFLRLPFGF